ncbi:unnamed protein product [Nyctereutes procyonoides]|uniref:(raccoon dog) hypothetical protein n=1 Tax=Nyctereutes procyonoides TaxID=34880 RepID=A0A811YE28_NYCPR|nr:unnamed protein product [Nyctereutes procyonoides]
MPQRRVGASGRFGEKGAGGPFIILEHGSRGLQAAPWDGLPCQAQVEPGSGLAARWSGGPPGAGLSRLAWAWLACASPPGASLGGHRGHPCLAGPGLEDPGPREPKLCLPTVLGWHRCVLSCPLGTAAFGGYRWGLQAAGAAFGAGPLLQRPPATWLSYQPPVPTGPEAPMPAGQRGRLSQIQADPSPPVFPKRLPDQRLGYPTAFSGNIR